MISLYVSIQIMSLLRVYNLITTMYTTTLNRFVLNNPLPQNFSSYYRKKAKFFHGKLLYYSPDTKCIYVVHKRMNPDGTEYMGTILIGNVEGDDVYIDTDKDELCDYSSIKIMDSEFSYLPEIENWSSEKEHTIHFIPIKKIVKLEDGKDIAKGSVVPIPEATMYYEPKSNRVYSCNFCGDTGKIEKLCSPEDNSCYGFAWNGECIDDVLICSEFIVWDDDDEPIRDGPTVHLCKKRYYPKTITFTLDRFTFSRAYEIANEVHSMYPHSVLKKYYDKILYFSQDTGCIYLVYTKQNPDLSDYIEILPIGKVESSSAYVDKSTDELCDYTRIKLSYIGPLPKAKDWYEEKTHSVNLFRIKNILEVGSIDDGGSDGGGSDSKEIFMMKETMYYDYQSKRVRTIYFCEDTCSINKDCFGWYFSDCYGFAWNGEYMDDTLVCSKFDT